MRWDGVPITAIKRTFVRHAEDCDLPGCTPGTVRHFMATMVRRGKPPVPKEQRDVWLGHDEKRTANACEAFDPEYLRDGAFAPFVRPTPQKRPVASRSRSYRLVSGNGGNQDSRRTIQLS
jgi:hypothetical protein